MSPQPSTVEDSSSSSAIAGPPPTKKSSLGSLFKDAAKETQPVLSPEQQVKAEVAAYEAFPKLDPEEDPLNPLKCWNLGFQLCANLHNHIYLFAQRALHLNACSAPRATLSHPRELLLNLTKLTCLFFLLKTYVLLMYALHFVYANLSLIRIS